MKLLALKKKKTIKAIKIKAKIILFKYLNII